MAYKDLNIGVVVLGQTPREDIEEIFSGSMPGVHVNIKGALDQERPDTIEKLSQTKLYPLFVRLRNGSITEISMNALNPFILKCGNYLVKEGSNLLILWCSGNFKKLDFGIPVIYPSKIIAFILKCICCTNRLDILIPNSNQYSSAKEEWSKKGYQANILSANPLNYEEIESVSSMFSKNDSELLILDCMSYSQKHVNLIKNVYNKPIICPQNVLPIMIRSIYT